MNSFTTDIINGSLNIPKFTGYNDEYTLQLNTNVNIKYFKDELTIKYVGKGITTNDYAVSYIN